MSPSAEHRPGELRAGQRGYPPGLACPQQPLPSLPAVELDLTGIPLGRMSLNAWLGWIWLDSFRIKRKKDRSLDVHAPYGVNGSAVFYWVAQGCDTFLGDLQRGVIEFGCDCSCVQEIFNADNRVGEGFK